MTHQGGRLGSTIPTEVPATLSPTHRFLSEADMLAAIARAPVVLAGRRRARRAPEVLFEFFAAEGTPDIVLLEFDADELERRDRLGLGPVLNYNAVAALLVLGAGPRSTAELAQATRVTGAHLRRTILPELVEAGWVTRPDGLWQSPVPIRPLARWIVAVEAKRRDWRRAIGQAQRYRRFANRVVVVLDASANLPSAHAALAAFGDIGLASVDAKNGRLRPVVVPPWQRATSERDRVLAGEHAYCMRGLGVSSGPVAPVFGRILLATNGEDPRISGRPSLDT